METLKLTDQQYKDWLIELKSKIRSTQIKASLAVNATLGGFYWELGKMISEKEGAWGSKLIERLAKDLHADFPEMKGFSERNINYCRKFYQFYTPSIVQQPVAQFETVNNADIFHQGGGKLADSHIFQLNGIKLGYFAESKLDAKSNVQNLHIAFSDHQ